MAEIRLNHVTKIFDKRIRAVDDVALEVADREFVVLLGPSGCGKTTLMRLIAGLEYPDMGRIMIGGRDVTDLPPRKRQIAMVFQSYAVFPHLTVFDNIAFGLKMRRMEKAEVKRKVESASDLVELTPYLNRYPANLSGGQRQRVAVARAIVMEPDVLLMDEPLSNLDALLRLNFRAELKRLVRELRPTTIYVTHDQVEAMSLGDRIAVMRDGQVVQSGTPMEVYDRPATEFVGGFIGNPPMNFLKGRLAGQDGRVQVDLGEHALPAPVHLGGLTGQEVLVGIRAENIEASTRSVDGALAARTEVVEPLGPQLMVTALLGNQRLKLLTHTDFAVEPDDQIWLRPEVGKLRWYDPATGQEVRGP